MIIRAAAMAALLLMAGIASAETVRKVRYTDSSGQAHIVDSMKNVPGKYRASATIVRVRQREEEIKKVPVQKPMRKEPKRKPVQKPEQSPSKVPPSATESGKGEVMAERLAKVKEALKVTKRIEVEPIQSKWVVFTGEIQNQLDVPVSDAKITINVIDKQATELPPVVSDISGKSGKGIIDPEETVEINVISSIPRKFIAGFSYSLSWNAE